jgi:putative sugar O-methyltransferase
LTGGRENAVEPVSGLPGLGAMVAEMGRASDVVRPSRFWERMGSYNLEQLERSGFEDFKRTVNQNYFQWSVSNLRHDHFRAVLRAWLSHADPRVITARLPDALGVETAGLGGANPLETRRGRRLYAVFTAMLWEVARRRDSTGALARLEEPDLGRPLTTRYRGRAISQDLCNSVLEYSAIVEALPAAPRTVLELGAGYGRLAWVFLRELPGLRYVVCDIPPALAVSQRYLSELFPGDPVFGFRHFDAYAEVEGEFERARIAFITPNQLELIPGVGADLFVTISSLHEMRPDQIAHYLAAVPRHCDGFFYTKQWISWTNPDDRVTVGQSDYPIPSDWESVFCRPHPIQRKFFEALYKLPS